MRQSKTCKRWGLEVNDVILFHLSSFDVVE
jgi:hypothetical protein